jgi:DNA-binding cell septation regulator SpoVG
VNIEIEWHGDNFNLNLASKPGAEAFLSVKGCRLVDGNDGQFIGYPSTKNATSGKWWRHVGGSDKFNAAVLEKVLATQPRQSAPRGRQEDDGDIPF